MLDDDEKNRRKAQRADKKKLNSAWSQQVGRREEKTQRKEKKDRKKKWLKTQSASREEKAKEPDAKRVRVESDDDWAELAREERMAKKVRRGDITQQVFDQEFADL
jgi:ATP-dependent RNA helicase DDX55/SPB4